MILYLAVAAAKAAGTLAWRAAAAPGMLLALRCFYLPSRSRIDGEGITGRSVLRRRRRLAEVRHFVRDRHGGYLSPRARCSLLDAGGAMQVLSNAEREHMVHRLRAHLPGAA
ncbi:MAG: hypothetical protein AB1505_18350 [Candidatus Latescibacterota bacterium]